MKTISNEDVITALEIAAESLDAGCNGDAIRNLAADILEICRSELDALIQRGWHDLRRTCGKVLGNISGAPLVDTGDADKEKLNVGRME